MPDNNTYDERPIVDFPLLAAVTPILIGLMMIMMVAVDVVPDIVSALDMHMTESTQAVISKVQMKSIDGDNSDACRLEYNFKVDGKEYSSKYDNGMTGFSPRYCANIVGQTVSVAYNRDNPSVNKLSNDVVSVGKMILGALMRLPLALLLIVVGSISVHSVRSMRRHSERIARAVSDKVVSDAAGSVDDDFSQNKLIIK